MLHQPPHFSLTALALRARILIGGLFSDFRKTGRDTAYLRELNDFHLNDLGLHRVEREIKRYY